MKESRSAFSRPRTAALLQGMRPQRIGLGGWATTMKYNIQNTSIQRINNKLDWAQSIIGPQAFPA